MAELGERVAVIDASLAAKWAIPESGSDLALALAGRWGKQRTRLIAPGLILPEVANAVYKRIVRGEIDLATAKQAVRIVLGFGIEICVLSLRALDRR